ncbi:hypothetical protein WHR41_08038 [Cladosporium halotolerans]|uniref:Zn(2)-C6 fungal-type domain-containing protein n=1 Tax=Cladosporium halotolerans TaxID=1052096 RepID=A0AB34KHD9_9PEZI
MHSFGSAPMQHQHIPPYHIPPTLPNAPTPIPVPPAQHARPQPDTDRARAYKSRNKRPCDFCRYKKAACHLDNQPPCELCSRYNKECTFVESPAKRRRPNDTSPETQRQKQNGGHDAKPQDNHPFANGPIVADGLDMQPELMGWEGNMPPPYPMPQMSIPPPVDFAAYDPALYREPSMQFEPFNHMSNSTTDPALENMPAPIPKAQSSFDTTPSQQSVTLPLHLQLPFESTTGEASLDHQASSNAQMVGLSGESDPYLLSRYHFDRHNEASFQRIRVRQMCGLDNAQGDLPTYFAIQHNAMTSKAQPPERWEVLEQYRREVEDMVGNDVGKRLIVLFYKFVQPYFPVLSRSHWQLDENGICEPSSVPTCILAAIYGHALPFCAWDERLCVDVYTPPSADALFRLAWLACQPELHTPSLAVLQTMLLLVQRRPTNKHVSDTPFKWIMMTSAVAIAQTLGINRDPSKWPLPIWEVQLRRRLAWATFVQDKWLALNSGRSSHISPDDWDVSPLTDYDFEEADRALVSDNLSGTAHFLHLCSLTLIVSEILSDLFSLRATRQLQHSLEATIDVAKPLRIRLTEWHAHLPPGLKLPLSPSLPASPENSARPLKPPLHSALHQLDGNGSLHLAFITAKIELFRAMLRPRVEDANGATAVQALRAGALAVGREVLEFVDGLSARELEAFWASYSRTNFTLASSFLLHLFVSAPTTLSSPDKFQHARECLDLLENWRAALRVKSRSCDLLNLALLKLDGVFVRGLGELVVLGEGARGVWAERGGS